MIRTLIVDDEPLARSAVRIRLENERDIEIVGEAEDGPAALDAIGSLLPDLVFLDVQMPEMDGFEVVEKVIDIHMPVIVFVTAFDQYALKAFETQALDYLLKPFTDKRFRDALQRARKQIERDDAVDTGRQRELATTHQQIQSGSVNKTERASRFAVKDDGRFVFVKPDSIYWIEAARNNVKLVTRDRTYVMRSTMAALEQTLDPDKFARIHRSTIVNIGEIKEIRPEWHGDFDVELLSGAVLRMSRTYRANLLP